MDTTKVKSKYELRRREVISTKGKVHINIINPASASLLNVSHIH